MISDRLRQQMGFAAELDKLKQVFRQTYLLDGSRKENDAEHSWNFAMMAVLLAEYASAELDLLRVLKMVLIHDLVEIDAGDTYCYDRAGYRDKAERERRAADRIFGLLPADQATVFRSLWDEFEARESAEAKYAAALDRLQPLMNNYLTQGISWQEHGVGHARVIEQNQHMMEGAPELWEYARWMIDDALEKGYLSP